MLGFIVAIRNFIIAVLLSWIGINFSTPNEETVAQPELPEKTAPVQPEAARKR